MLASAAERYGANPMANVNGLGRFMADTGRIGTEVDGAPPRNERIILDGYIQPRILPNGDPVMFTGSNGERLFISSLGTAFTGIRRAVSALSSVKLRPNPSVDDVDELVYGLDLAKAAATSMHDANEKVTDVFDRDPKSGPFGSKFQPFFPELIIEGKAVKPSSGIQSGSPEMGLLLRAIDGDANPGGNAEYLAQFHNENVRYIPAYRLAEIAQYVANNRSELTGRPISIYTHIRNLPPGEARDRLARAYLGAVAADAGFSTRHYGTTLKDAIKNRQPDANGDYRGGGDKTMRQLKGYRDERNRHVAEAQRELGVAA